MKFPITREQLLAFDPIKDKEEEDNITLTKHIQYTINVIIKEFKLFMQRKSPELMSFRLRYVENMRKNIRNTVYLSEHLHSKDIYYPRLLEELRNHFTDCQISLDDDLIISWA